MILKLRSKHVNYTYWPNKKLSYNEDTLYHDILHYWENSRKFTYCFLHDSCENMFDCFFFISRIFTRFRSYNWWFIFRLCACHTLPDKANAWKTNVDFWHPLKCVSCPIYPLDGRSSSGDVRQSGQKTLCMHKILFRQKRIARSGPCPMVVRFVLYVYCTWSFSTRFHPLGVLQGPLLQEMGRMERACTAHQTHTHRIATGRLQYACRTTTVKTHVATDDKRTGRP